MDTQKKKLAKILLECYGDFDNEKTETYLKDHLEDYFSESFFDDFEGKVKWDIHDLVYAAKRNMDFEEEHVNDTVTLDKRKKMMYFNDNGVPAYWYKPGMSKKEINENLQEYKGIWANADFADFKYPLLETWHPLSEWKKGFTEDMFAKMERDLECEDTDDARNLAAMRWSGNNVWRVQQDYPTKIKKILKIENRRETNEEKFADITLLLYDDSTCKVEVHTSNTGRFQGMKSLGDRGFPPMTQRDDELIEKEVFGFVREKRWY